MRDRALLVLLCLVPLTQGCVAAAIPLVTGAAVARTQIDTPPPSSPVEERGGNVPVAPARIAATADRSDLRIVPTTLAELPAPDTTAPRNDPVIQAFARYAGTMAEAMPGREQRVSALLTEPSELNARRIPCGSRPLAVIIDLDPGRGTFDPLSPGQADPHLGTALAGLRAKGVAVIWLSRLGENFADAARAALAQGGLDPEGRDTLVLMRDLDERKQTRRDALAKAVCPIAILGDERADFDELYLYLKNPDTAIALDASLGRGWFLASPFTARQDRTLAGTRP